MSADVPRFIKDEFDAFLEWATQAHGLLKLRCARCGHCNLLAFNCKRRRFCPSCGAQRMLQYAAYLVVHIILSVLPLATPLRVLRAAQPKLITPVLQVQQRVPRRHLLDAAGLKAEEGRGGGVTLIQHSGSAANLNIPLHCLVLDGVYRCGVDGAPSFIEASPGKEFSGDLRKIAGTSGRDT
ncbi:transposase zinc-binding domain-containing protein [Pseudorhodoferax sp. Leaf267]|uniref:transposase zinc-binding domain-containing protein n=1 Tax=Pseudorhodoferax sp. Leaf267 TaxID=1736316 RepID=UPI0012E0CC07|nr:transposase zinc-binding domain-containing protein [Pseudorhodoferax sp. Leaf267]